MNTKEEKQPVLNFVRELEALVDKHMPNLSAIEAVGCLQAVSFQIMYQVKDLNKEK